MNQNPFERFTKEARLALQIAEQEVSKVKLDYIWTEHLMLWMLSVPNCIACSVLNNMWVTYETAKWVIIEFWNNGVESIFENTKISTYLSKIIEESLKIAKEFNHTHISNEHLLYAMVSNKKCAWNIVLENLQIETDLIKKQIEWFFAKFKWDTSQASGTGLNVPKSFEDLLNNLTWVVIWAVGWNKQKWFMWWFWMDDQQPQKKHESKDWKSKTPALDYFSTNLNEIAIKWKLDPVIWRNLEIQRVINTLNRKTKNNPVLVGEAGVWKTAIAEWLAQRIIAWEVPIWLINKQILSLDLWEVISGTKYRWEFEERMKEIIAEAVSEETNVILFIDELHTMIWLWASEWSLDTANILKPALARWTIQLIWATTLDEYRKYIEKDKALERRFQKVIVEEPNIEDSIEILTWIRSVFEKYHNVDITDEALSAAVLLSKRYMSERFLPDKAIDLLDEAAARKWWKAFLNTKKKSQLEEQIANNEKNKEKAVQEQDYQKALQLKNKEEELRLELEKSILPKVEKRIHKITEKDIMLVLSEITWISSLKLSKTEDKKITWLWLSLKRSIINQERAIDQIANSILRNRAWISDQNRPIWSFLLLWPTWVWKTETVKKLAEEIYQSKDALIKIDMSEFSERHNVSRLIWATAGYVGHEEWWQLTEAVRRRPYAIVLFDEIEKAHPESYNILLQILEDWYLTDSKWRKVDFKNTIIVLTSNIWAETLTQEAKAIWFETDEKKMLKDAVASFEEKSEEVLEEVKDYFLPELLNRIDKVIIFNPLDKKAIKSIVKMNLVDLEERLKLQNIWIEVSDIVIADLANLSYSPEQWARRVRKVIQEYIEEQLSQQIIEWRFAENEIAKVIRKNWSKNEFEIVKKRIATQKATKKKVNKK